jgi:hypothetical protein
LGPNVPAFFTILTVNVLAFISSLGPNNKPKLLKIGPKFFGHLSLNALYNTFWMKICRKNTVKTAAAGGLRP